MNAGVEIPDLRVFAKVHARVYSVWCGEENNNYFVPAATQLQILIFIRAVGKLNVTVDGEDITSYPPTALSGTPLFYIMHFVWNSCHMQ